MKLSEVCGLYLDYCKNIKNLSTLSVNAYYHDLKSFQNLMGEGCKIATVSRQSIYQYIDSLFEEEKSASTVKRRIACLKTMFKWLDEEGIIQHNPFSKFDLKIKIPRRLPRNIKVNELKQMAQSAQACVAKLTTLNKTPRKRDICALNALLIIEILYSTGIRVSELTSIRLNDINFHAQSIHINGKGQRERQVFLPDHGLINLINSYIQTRSILSKEHDYLLINSRGTPLSSQSARLIVKDNAKRAKISRPITPHMYRHSTATQLLEAGVDIRYVQQLLGHESIQTTEIYTHVENSALKKQIMKADIRRRIL